LADCVEKVGVRFSLATSNQAGPYSRSDESTFAALLNHYCAETASKRSPGTFSTQSAQSGH
jgi:hypothetical protein